LRAAYRANIKALSALKGERVINDRLAPSGFMMENDD